jgi:hypothetical protein
MAMTIQVMFSCVVMTFSDTVSNYRFGGPCCLKHQREDGEDGGSAYFRNYGIVLHHYTVPEPQLENSVL